MVQKLARTSSKGRHGLHRSRESNESCSGLSPLPSSHSGTSDVGDTDSACLDVVSGVRTKPGLGESLARGHLATQANEYVSPTFWDDVVSWTKPDFTEPFELTDFESRDAGVTSSQKVRHRLLVCDESVRSLLSSSGSVRDLVSVLPRLPPPRADPKSSMRREADPAVSARARQRGKQQYLAIASLQNERGRLAAPLSCPSSASSTRGEDSPRRLQVPKRQPTHGHSESLKQQAFGVGSEAAPKVSAEGRTFPSRLNHIMFDRARPQLEREIAEIERFVYEESDQQPIPNVGHAKDAHMRRRIGGPPPGSAPGAEAPCVREPPSTRRSPRSPAHCSLASSPAMAKSPCGVSSPRVRANPCKFASNDSSHSLLSERNFRKMTAKLMEEVSSTKGLLLHSMQQTFTKRMVKDCNAGLEPAAIEQRLEKLPLKSTLKSTFKKRLDSVNGKDPGESETRRSVGFAVK